MFKSDGSERHPLPPQSFHKPRKQLVYADRNVRDAAAIAVARNRHGDLMEACTNAMDRAIHALFVLPKDVGKLVEVLLALSNQRAESFI